MIFDLPNIHFTDDEWIYILEVMLKGWTEIPFSTTNGYSKDEVKFYDGFIGLLLKHTEKMEEMCPSLLNKKFVSSWRYQGKLYRVIHKRMIEDDLSDEGYALPMPDIEYHGMITHWTTDYRFSGLNYKLNLDSKYIILEANTKERHAFDVNGFREVYGAKEVFTEGEQEVIFPMYKEYITEHHMTINEFIDMKKNEKN